MTSRWVVTDTDIRALLGIVARCQPAADEGDDIFYVDVLAGLRELIPCDDITFELIEFADKRVTALGLDDDGVYREGCTGPEGDGGGFSQVFWMEGGCASELAANEPTNLLHHAEKSRTLAFANSQMGSAFAEMDVIDKIQVTMTPLEGTDRSLLLWRLRGAPDFTEREKAMLSLIRPHVAELHTRRVRQRRGEPHLTARQWQVMCQVATGASNTQIAHTLGLSEATVRKHLENVFLRLGVQSRTEALARVHTWLDAGPMLRARTSA